MNAFEAIADGFKAKMAKLGYIEGQNVIYNTETLIDDITQDTAACRKLVENRVDLIFAFPTNGSVAAKKATKDTNTPVVFAMSGIEGNNLVKQVAQPGGNITGVRYPGPDLSNSAIFLFYVR